VNETRTHRIAIVLLTLIPLLLINAYGVVLWAVGFGPDPYHHPWITEPTTWSFDWSSPVQVTCELLVLGTQAYLLLLSTLAIAGCFAGAIMVVAGRTKKEATDVR